MRALPVCFVCVTSAIVAVACSRPIDSESKSNLDGWVGTGTLEVQHGRLATTTADRSASGCEQHAPPGVVDDTERFHYRAHRFVNEKPVSACIEVVATQYTGRSSDTGFRVAAYTAFDPDDVTRNYLGDSGVADTTTHRFAFTVPAHAEYEVVVTGAAVGTSAAKRGVTYRVDVRECEQPSGGDRS